MQVNIDVSVLPMKSIGAISIINMKNKILRHTIEFESIDFLVGFRMGGQLVRLKAQKKK